MEILDVKILFKNTLNSDFFFVINDETKIEKSNSLMLDNEYQFYMLKL